MPGPNLHKIEKLHDMFVKILDEQDATAMEGHGAALIVIADAYDAAKHHGVSVEKYIETVGQGLRILLTVGRFESAND